MDHPCMSDEGCKILGRRVHRGGRGGRQERRKKLGRRRDSDAVKLREEGGEVDDFVCASKESAVLGSM
eukprot:766055-Hanusia_phi.AAC.1